MKRLFATLVILACQTVCAHAEIIDQQQSISSGMVDWSTSIIDLKAESFVAGVSGKLTRIEVAAQSGDAGSTFALMQIVSATGGVADMGTVLSATVAMVPHAVGAPGLVSFNFGTQPTLAAGQEYAMVMSHVAGHSTGFGGATSNAYISGIKSLSVDGGTSWSYAPSYDLAFVTHMDIVAIPEPGSFTMAVFAASGGLVCMRRRKRRRAAAKKSRS